MLVSFVYLVACRLFSLALLLARGDRSKELELLVLRHELSILRRQAYSQDAYLLALEQARDELEPREVRETSRLLEELGADEVAKPLGNDFFFKGKVLTAAELQARAQEQYEHIRFLRDYGLA